MAVVGGVDLDFGAKEYFVRVNGSNNNNGLADDDNNALGTIQKALEIRKDAFGSQDTTVYLGNNTPATAYDLPVIFFGSGGYKTTIRSSLGNQNCYVKLPIFGAAEYYDFSYFDLRDVTFVPTGGNVISLRNIRKFLIQNCIFQYAVSFELREGAAGTINVCDFDGAYSSQPLIVAYDYSRVSFNSNNDTTGLSYTQTTPMFAGFDRASIDVKKVIARGNGVLGFVDFGATIKFRNGSTSDTPDLISNDGKIYLSSKRRPSATPTG